jgi:hypothetical protein
LLFCDSTEGEDVIALYHEYQLQNLLQRQNRRYIITKWNRNSSVHGHIRLGTIAKGFLIGYTTEIQTLATAYNSKCNLFQERIHDDVANALITIPLHVFRGHSKPFIEHIFTHPLRERYPKKQIEIQKVHVVWSAMTFRVSGLEGSEYASQHARNWYLAPKNSCPFYC